jgi:8-oxo-dGTP diphosphatase
VKQGIDYTGIAVVYFCHDGKGNVFMAQRNENARDEEGRWDIGGGAVEFGATLEETMRKEIKEEYCADVLAFEFLGYREVHRVHHGKPTHWIAFDFKVLIDRSQAALGEPHKFQACGWFTVADQPTHVHSQLPTFLEKYKDRL